MHNKEQLIDKNVKTLEKRNLNEEQQKNLVAFKVVYNYCKAKQEQGLALTSEDEAVLDSLLIIVTKMVKDSSIT
jgi:hypothetical protein